jgi:16S rRNA (uracil1498-N3)-methyltransferase
LILFNGGCQEYQAIIEQIDGKQILARIHQSDKVATESELEVNIAQGLAKSDKMDWIIQKACELGVKAVTPVFTDRSQVKLDDNKRDKKRDHWQKIARHACEQSGRTQPPAINLPINLSTWLTKLRSNNRLMLATHGLAVHNLSIKAHELIHIAIGPEGGFSAKEQDMLLTNGFQSLKLGPRVLRTETAGLAALSALQTQFGDFMA